MPVVLELIADLGAVIVCITGLLFAVAIYLFCNALATLLRIKLPIIGTVNLGSAFASVGDDVMSWMVDATKDTWVHIVTIFLGTAYMLDHTFNAVVRAISHGFDYADHIVTNTVPNAIETAVDQSTVNLDNRLTVVGQDILNDTGVVGGAVGTVVAGALTAAEHYAAHDLTVATNYADARLTDDENYTDRQVGALATAIGQQLSTLTATVANDYASAKSYAESQAAAALSTAKGLVNDAITETEKYADADMGLVQANLNTAVGTINGTVSALTTTVGTDLTDAEQYAQGQVAAGLQDVVSTLNGTQAVVGGAIASAASGVAGAISGVATGARTDATDALNDATTALGDALAGVTSDITGTAQAFTGDLSGIEGLLAGAITGSIAGVLTRVAAIEECYVGNCDNSQFPFKSLLQDALGIVDLGAMGAFIASAISDPADAAAGFVSVASGLYSDATGFMDTILSL